MTHLTTADVLLIGIIAFPFLRILTYLGQYLLMNIDKLLIEKIEIPEEMATALDEQYPGYGFSAGIRIIKVGQDFLVRKETAHYSGGGSNNAKLVFLGIIPTLLSYRRAKDSPFPNHYISFLRGTVNMAKLCDAIYNAPESEKVYKSGYLIGRYSTPSSYEDKPEVTVFFKKTEVPSTTYYGTADHQAVEQDVARFLANKKFYKERNLPYHRGYLLHGLPGTGKSTFVKYLAQKFGLPILIVDGVEEAKKLYNKRTPVIVLIEDIDTLFRGRTPVKRDQKLEFDDLLNAMSGVQSLENVLWFVTTNDLSSLDSALGIPLDEKVDLSRTTRPGRLDFALRFGYASKEQKIQIARRFLLEATPADLAANLTASTYEDICRTRILEKN